MTGIWNMFHRCTRLLISPQPDLLPDIFCLMVTIFRLILILLHIYIYVYGTNIPPIMIVSRIYEHQKLLSLQLLSFLVGLMINQRKNDSLPGETIRKVFQFLGVTKWRRGTLGRSYCPISFVFLITNELRIKTQYLPRSKHSFSTRQSTQLMLCVEIVDVNCENPINTEFMKDISGDVQRIVTAQL